MPGPATVRLVVLNYNGGEHVLRCVERLLAVHWPPDALQVVVVDNASVDGSDHLIEQRHPEVRLVRSPRNSGFPANNLALRDLDDVDFVGLVNNDAFVEPGYLAPLVEALEADPGLGAVCPRILLAPRFVSLRLRTRGWQAPGDERVLGVRISGLLVDGRAADRQVVFGDGTWPAERGGALEPEYRWTGPEATVHVPVGDGPDDPGRVRVEVRLSAPRVMTVTLGTGANEVEVEVGPQPTWYHAVVAGAPHDLVNNVGSELVVGGWGRDRGFLQPDKGQFEEPVDVFAWCGAAVLFPTRYLRDVGLFDERFFMYYEDTDLAWRGRLRGWRYRYIPNSVVRHIHAATSVEGSGLFHHYVERNRLIMLTKNAPPGYAARAAWLYLLATASYARRDVVRAVVRGRRPSLQSSLRRLRSFVAYLRLVPELVKERRSRPTPVVHDEELLGWAVDS